jgi:integrase
MSGMHATAARANDAERLLAEPPWRWPIALTGYDRTPALSAVEADALRSLGDDGLRAWARADRAEFAALERLLRPLADARAARETRSRHGALAADAAVAEVLRWCAAEGTSYWGWERATWIRMLGTDQQAFAGAHPRWVDRSARHYLIGLAYLLRCFVDLRRLGEFKRVPLAEKVFGSERIHRALDTVDGVLRAWGYQRPTAGPGFPRIVSEALLANASPRLSDLTPAVLDALRAAPDLTVGDHSLLHQLQRGLAALGLAASPGVTGGIAPPVEGVSAIWQEWVTRWEATSVLTRRGRRHVRTCLLKVGRWLAATHPEGDDPARWTRDLCAAYVAAVERMRVGEHVQRAKGLEARLGQPLAARSKEAYLGALRQFFRDCQEWGWFPRRFDPSRALATPRSIKALIGPNPRVIADEIWAKLLWAGLNFEPADLPRGSTGACFYPLELVRALALTWLFGGLRSDEIARLRVGCIRRQREMTAAPGDIASGTVPAEVCFLDVPAHKTGTAFTKPVDPLLGQAIRTWEAVRPAQPPLLDPRTGERVGLLFCYRARRVAPTYLNHAVIPALCRKGGVPLSDARGRITSHRARSTIASQLYNAKEPMTLFELQEWLGHRSPATTQHYARITPTKLAQAYADAGYFARNVRTVEVLIDRDAVESGAAARGEPWQYLDLGHGYCTYSFFEACPHRMACARCDFYVPKASTKAELLEAKGNLQRMLEAIPLTEDERAAVEDGAQAVDQLLCRLADVPTPAGPTPRQLARRREIPLRAIDAHSQLEVDT